MSASNVFNNHASHSRQLDCFGRGIGSTNGALDVNVCSSSTTPFELDVSRGLVDGITSLYKFGFNYEVREDEDTIWAQGGVYTWPTSAATRWVSSSSGNDVGGGTGARTIKIFGLDTDYNEIDETLSLTGQTQKETANSYLRIFRAYVVTVGSNGDAVGDIYIADAGAVLGVPTSTIYAKIVGPTTTSSGQNQTQLGIYTVPAGKTLYLDDVIFTAGISQANVYGTVRFKVREFGSVFRTIVISTLQSNANRLPFCYPYRIPEKSDIELTAQMSGGSAEIAGSFQGVLVDNNI